MKYDRKYNTPGLRMPQKAKDPFGNFKKRMDHERPRQERTHSKIGIRAPEKGEADPLWMRRTFLALAIPAVLIAFFGIGYILYLNIANTATFVTGEVQTANRQLNYAQVQSLPPADRYVYYGQQDMIKMQYRPARLNFQQALALDPTNPEANMGLYSALLGLVKKDRGWNKQLKEQEERMRVLRE